MTNYINICLFGNSIVNVYNTTSTAINTYNNILIASARQALVCLITSLKLSSLFLCDTAIDAFAIDCPQNFYRFSIIYIIQSSLYNYQVQITTKIADKYTLFSIQAVFAAFNWAEREIWDLTGILSIKHFDLRRILTDYGFIGHPLRKDFPLSGFWETGYTDMSKQVIYTIIELSQGLRLLNILNNWNHA